MNSFDMKAFGHRLRMARTDAKLSQGELAKKAEVSLTTISTCERGETIPMLSTAFQLAVALNCTPNDLMGWKEAV